MVGGHEYDSQGTEKLIDGDNAWTTLSYKLPFKIVAMASVSLDNKIFFMGEI